MWRLHICDCQAMKKRIKIAIFSLATIRVLCWGKRSWFLRSTEETPKILERINNSMSSPQFTANSRNPKPSSPEHQPIASLVYTSERRKALTQREKKTHEREWRVTRKEDIKKIFFVNWPNRVKRPPGSAEFKRSSIFLVRPIQRLP